MVPEILAQLELETSKPASSPDIKQVSQKRLTSNDNGNGSQAQFPKKTRDLPNLSECHNCHYRINTNNGKDRLQILPSEWRIVLLCRNCFCRVDSGQLCPYCFSQTSGDECFLCSSCTRHIHKCCALRFNSSAPCSYYSFSGSNFSVCVDCWLPESLLKLRSRVGSRRGCRSRKIGMSDRIVVSKEGSKSLEDVVTNANFSVKKKVEAAAKARQIAVTKAIAARRAVELANSALDLVVKNEETVRDCTDNKVVGDAELAFQLHQALNCSPRISRNLCSVNSNCLVVPENGKKCNGQMSIRASGFEGHQENGKCNGNKNNAELAFMDEEKTEDSNRLDTDENCLNDIKPQSKSNGGRMANRYYFKYSKRNSKRCQSNSDARYFLKYSKRNSSSKQTPRCRPKFLYEGCQRENQFSMSGINHCSKMCSTSCDDSFQSSAVPKQAYAGASDSLGD